MLFRWKPMVIFMPPPAPSSSPGYAPESLIIIQVPRNNTTCAADAMLDRTSRDARERDAAQVGR